MVLQYKCPNCGGDMNFDSQSGMLSCDSCGRKDNIDTYKEETKDQDTSTSTDYEEFVDETNHNTFEEDQATQYQCKNCGAVLITDADTTATTCSFCGAGVVLGDRLSGSLAPAKVIPFTISKEQAQEAFKKWCRKGLLTPRGFMNADRIKSITGMYIPFWLYDLHARAEASATCTRVRTYSDSEYVYTETQFYDIYRKVDLDYDKVPCDASEKMDDKLMDKLEPYSYADLKEFNTPYLAGYIAEKYNYTDRDLFPRVESRADKYVSTYIRSTIQGYTTTNIHNENIDIRQRNADYTLLPIWMVCYDYNKADHIFAMNGQTGKLVGKPPLSAGKIAGWFGGISVVSFAIIKIIAMIAGGA